MGLVNRVVPDGTALDHARGLGHELAALPQTCLRNDRRSTMAQWGLSLAERPGGRDRLGLDSLASPDAGSGAARFAVRRRRGGGFGRRPPPDPDRRPRVRPPTARRGRLRLRRHADRGRQRVRLPRGPVGRPPAGAGGRRGPGPPPGPRRPGRRGRGRPGQGAPLRAGAGRQSAVERAEEVGGRVRPPPPGPPPAPRRCGNGSTGTGGGATGWSSSRRRPRSTSGRPATGSGPTGWSPPAWPSTTRRRADRPLPGEQLPRRREAPAPAGVDRRVGRARPGRLWAYGNSRGDLGDAARPPTSGSTWGASAGWGGCGPSRASTGPRADGPPAGLTGRPGSQVLLLPHPHQHEPPPDGGQVGGEQALDEHGGHRVVSRGSRPRSGR